MRPPWGGVFTAPGADGILALAFGQCLFDVSQDVVDMLDADGQPYQIFAGAGRGQFFGVKLPVRGGGGVACLRFVIADIDKKMNQLQGVDETLVVFLASFVAKCTTGGRFDVFLNHGTYDSWR